VKQLRKLFVLQLGVLVAASVSAQAVVVAPFRSVESRSGAHVTVRHGNAQSVQILAGSPKVSVTAGRLIIDNRGRPHQPRARIEIVTPNLDGLAVEDGGQLKVESGFTRLGTIAAAVANGGALDLRNLPVDQVSASVTQGGMIAVRPAKRLVASVSHGGIVTYWGQPAVSSSIHDGGAVARGSAEEAGRPLWNEPKLGGDE